jgi:hypothetical protein
VAFVQDFKVVDHPYEQVLACFESGIVPLIKSGLGPAHAESERLRIKVAPAGWPAVVAKTVEVHPGRVRSLGDSVLFGFSWEASETSLFPRLDADLEVAPFGTQQTLVAIRGQYEPPAGVFGRRADGLVMNRLAESTMRAFLEGLCASLEASAVPG